MVKKVVKFLISALGILIGYGVVALLFQTNLINVASDALQIVIYAVVMALFGVILYLFSDRIINYGSYVLDEVEKVLTNIPPTDIVFGAFGLLFGLILSFFISASLRAIETPLWNSIVLVITIIIYVVLGTMGARLAIRYKGEVLKMLPNRTEEKLVNKKRYLRTADKVSVSAGCPKILDTSVIIDGRILNIVESGFLDGPLVIAEFVLEELQFIADSSDELKRERGRRGLDIVKDIQESKKVEVIISDRDYEDVAEVDIKLLKLTQELNGKVMTNDYNLNKVASVQDIPVLNVNDLANAVKTIVIPGERMRVTIIKEGKEKKQGLAYLSDGTMIVVEDAKTRIGEDLDVIVTTVLQTAAGKMIFAKPIN